MKEIYKGISKMLKLLKRLKKTDYLYIGIAIIFIVCQVWLDLKLPDYMSNITKLVQTEGSAISEILEQGAYMLGCALGSLTLAFITGYFVAKIAAGFAKNLREAVFNKTVDFSMEEINKFSTSSLITRTTNDITQIQTIVAMGLQLMIKAPITVVWAITKMAGKSFTWSAITGGAVMILVFVIGLIIFVAMPKFKKVQKLTDNLNGITRENLTGIRVVRAFNAEKYQEEKFEDANVELTNTNLFTQRIMALLNPTMSLIMSGLTLVIYLTGAYIIDGANMMDKIGIFSDMVVFTSYSMQVIMSFMMLSMMFMMYPRSSVSAKRVLEVLETKGKITDGDITKTSQKNMGTVEFKNVSFKYPDSEDYILKDISFKLRKGETLAIIGSTGSGKSTLLNLIPRFYDATVGLVLVDGINVREMNQESLHRKLGYVPQKAFMFNGTIKDNITYGEEKEISITENQINKAIQVSQSEEFISKMENGYESHIAQGGTNISGGQKQRLSIARAITRNPEIYLFDDTFSALDYKTDFNVRKELNKYTENSTKIIVAQRIGTIKDADKIIVLDQGRMVGYGTHKELLKECETYKEIALSQLSEEELKNGTEG